MIVLIVDESAQAFSERVIAVAEFIPHHIHTYSTFIQIQNIHTYKIITIDGTNNLEVL